MHRDPWSAARRLAQSIRAQPDREDELLERARLDDPEVAERAREILVRERGPATAPLQPSTLFHTAELARRGIVKGARIGEEFELIRPLRTGGTSVVWIARQRGAVEREVALKILLPLTEHFESTMHREAHALAELQHPDIATVHAAGVHEADGLRVPWIALEYFEGGKDLHTVCRTLGVRKKLEVISRLCRAMDHAHRRGIYHLDLKPGNVLARKGREGIEVRVVDFGIAGTEGGDPVTLHGGGAPRVGTLPYASPEQLARDPGAAQSSLGDIYGLTVLLYLLLTDTLPFDVADLTPAQAAERVGTTGSNPTLEGLTPPDAAWICHRGLHRDRGARYGSVGELGADIERLLAHRPIVARPSTWEYRLERFWIRNRRTFAWAGSAVLAAALSFAEARRRGRIREDRLVERADELEQRGRELTEANRTATAHLSAEEELAKRREELDPTGFGRVAGPPGMTESSRLAEIRRALDAAVPSDAVDHEEALVRIAAAIQLGVGGHHEKALLALPPAWGDLLAAATRRAIDVETQYRYGRARSLSNSNQLGAALVEANRLIELDPRKPHAFTNRASLLRRLGRFREAIQDLEEGLHLAPDDPGILHALATNFEHLGDLETSLRYFEETCAAAPGHPMAQFNRGLVLSRLGRRTEAVEAHRRAAELSPDEPGPWRHLAGELFRAGRFEESLEPYDRYAELATGADLGHCLLERGQSRYRTGRVEGGLADLEAAAELLPQPLLATLESARALHRSDRTEEALAILQGVDPSESDELETRRLAYIGAFQLELGRYRASVESLTLALDLDPERLAARQDRAKAWSALDELDSAEADLAWILGRIPTDPDARLERARVRSRRGDRDGAVEDLRTLIEARPEEASYRTELEALLDGSGS